VIKYTLVTSESNDLTNKDMINSWNYVWIAKGLSSQVP
jgi:hypothetical protein